MASCRQLDRKNKQKKMKKKKNTEHNSTGWTCDARMMKRQDTRLDQRSTSPYAELCLIFPSKNILFLRMKHSGDIKIAFYEIHSLTRLIYSRRFLMGLLQ